MFCPKCGTQQSSLSRICIKCGSPLPATGKLPSRITTNPLENPLEPPAENPQPNPPRNSWQNRPQRLVEDQQRWQNYRVGNWMDPRPLDQDNSNAAANQSLAYQPGQYLGTYSPEYQPGSYLNGPQNWPANQNSASVRAISALVCGLMAFAFCPIISAFVAVILGHLEIKAIQQGTAPPAGKTIAQIGFYLGIVNISIYAGIFLMVLLASIFS